MSKSSVILLSFLFLCVCAAAQPPDGEYYPYAESEERMPVLLTDSAIFYRAVQSAPDLYGKTTGFNLPRVVSKRRGQGYDAETASVEGVGVSYRYFSVLRAMGVGEYRRPGLAMTPETMGGTGGVSCFRFGDEVPLMPYRLSVHFTDRNYLAGAKLSAAHGWGRGWSGAMAVDVRTGRDLHVEGVFTNALTAGFRIAKRFEGDHRLALLVVAPVSMRGTRLSSVEEAFTLTGDRLYNPAWGFQDGKVRNSRVRREMLPLAVASYAGALSPSTEVAAAFGVEAGVSKYSSLGWYNARTPLPDNYRYLPGYTGDRETDLAWRSGDARYTQIDWDGMIAQNRMAGTDAIYTLEDRAEQLRNLHFDLRFTTAIDERLSLHYGLYYRHASTRAYKQMRDLLGAQRIIDIDQYLVDDDTYGNLLQNDLHHPDRVIGEGDRFGYDYSMTTREMGVQLHAEYRADRFRADVACRFSEGAIRRRGHYEKELFPGNQSYGRSQRMRFTPYDVKALAGWAFSPRSYIEVAAAVGARMPEAENLFYQPLYNNRTVDNPEPERYYASEANYSLTGPVFELHLTLFVAASLDGVQTRRNFDDLAGVFSDVAVTGIGRLSYGVEAAAGIRLSYRWRLSLAASAGRSRYIRNPSVTVLSDVNNTAIDSRAESFMGDCEVGGAPRFTGCAEIGYFGPKGWGARASAGYAGGRYVEPAPLRRTQRIARQGGVTQEAFEAFVGQERLNDAFTLDASLFKTFYFGASRLTTTLMLRNLLGDHDTVYNAYESLRVRRIPAGDATLWEPHATRYTYIYPRSFYVTISYNF